MTKREIEKKYNIGHSRLTYWLKEIGFDDSKPSIVSLPKMEDYTNKLVDKEAEESVSH